jgi:hypothetical protein
MLHDVLVDAGATDFIIENPPKENPRWWLANKLMSIWDGVADFNLNYYHTGIPIEKPFTVTGTAAENWFRKNAARLRKNDSCGSFLPGLKCFANDEDITKQEPDWITLPPDEQISAFKGWMQHIWGDECPIEAFQ